MNENLTIRKGSKMKQIRTISCVAVLIVGILCCAGVNSAQGTVIYVDDDRDGDGTSWEDAYKYLQDALDDADSGDEIRVAEGTYKPSKEVVEGDARSATFQLESGVSIYGGYPNGGGSRDPNLYDDTILSGDIGTVANSDNCYHVVTGSGTGETAVLDGFKITKGHAADLGEDPPVGSSSGGGMYNYNSGSPTVTNCSFTSNSAGSGGGGMYNFSSSPTLDTCTFEGNSASSGGGMCNSYSSSPTLDTCTFTNNSAEDYGGGMSNYGTYNHESNPTLYTCTFEDNSSDDHGGGMADLYSSPTLDTCTFTNNSAEDYGGGMYNHDSRPTLEECTFTNNKAFFKPPMGGGGEACAGGGMYNEWGTLAITDCHFTGNEATNPYVGEPGGNGGGMYNLHVSNAEITNCTFSSNFAGNIGGGIYNDSSSVALTNCTFTSNSANHLGGGLYYYNCGGPLTNCTFTSNSARRGGGIRNSSTGTLMLKKCTFTSNSAEDGGGGIENTSGLVLANCIFCKNSTDSVGGAIKNLGGSAELANCIFSCNSAGDKGGAMLNYDNATRKVINCTFSGNSAPANSGGGMYNWWWLEQGRTTVTNCIFWNDVGGEIVDYYTGDGQDASEVTYTDIEGGWGDPNNLNINADPNFASDPNCGGQDCGDLHLTDVSPCIDAGDANSLPEDTTDLDNDSNTTEDIPYDIDAQPRVLEENVDMGADETYYVCATCLGDLNGDDQIDLQDLDDMTNRLVAVGPPFIVYPTDPEWHPCGDMDDDGDMDLMDLDALVNLLVEAGSPFIVPCPE